MTELRSEQDLVATTLGELVREAADGAAAESGADSRARLLYRAELESGRRSARGPWWGLALASVVACMAAAFFAFAWWRTPPSLTYEVIGANKDGVYVSAPDERPVTVRFSDATTLQVAAASRLRIETAMAHGARVFVERGDAEVHVVHRQGARWTFAAGPFDVLVTGTRFTLAWDPSFGVFDLKLLEGAVEIQTPFGAAPVSLHAGQQFRADLRSRSMTTTDAHDATPGATPPFDLSERDSGAPGAPEGDDGGGFSPVGKTAMGGAPSVRGLVSKATPAKPWAALVAAGQFAPVLDQVENERGIETCLRTCTASDLRAVADAARYLGRGDLASKSLRALVARFPQQASGRDAAFLLGRLLEQQGDSSEARSWYERYRSQVPGGTYAAEALAGAMRTTLATEGRAAARSVAQDYLTRYPAGADAATARGILGPP